MVQARRQARSQKPAASVKAAASRKSFRIRRLAVLSIAAFVRLVMVTVKSLRKNAATCHGAGKVKKQRKIHVKIPAGVDDGAQLRVSGEGEGGTRGGPSGDLYVVIRVKSHEFFEREGDDVYCEVPLTFTASSAWR